MIRLTALTSLAALLATGMVPMARASASHASVIVTPTEAHAGGTLYLSGSGFPAKRLLRTQLRCGATPKALLVVGPTTDRNGQFAGFGVKAPAGRVAAPRKCSALVVASVATRADSSFKLLPSTRALKSCAIRICVRVRALLVRLRNYAQGNIAVNAWPGATAVITVTGSDGKTQRRRMILDWHGVAGVRLRVAPGLREGVRSTVTVRVRLGSVGGSGTAPFTVIPGGR